MEREIQFHNIAPVYDAYSQVLILGSFPSVRSRADGFFYAHPQNRFWRVLAALFACPTPQSIEEKTALLHTQHLALWDVCSSCTVRGSGDASIRDAVPNDIPALLQKTRVRAIYANGTTAASLYRRLVQPAVGILAVTLPSTSAANASFGFDRLVESWRPVQHELLK